MPENKNEVMLTSFVQYCIEYPKQRFFQALRNWVRENIDADCNYICIAPNLFAEVEPEVALNSLKDTFYYDDDRLRQGGE